MPGLPISCLLLPGLPAALPPGLALPAFRLLWCRWVPRRCGCASPAARCCSLGSLIGAQLQQAATACLRAGSGARRSLAAGPWPLLHPRSCQALDQVMWRMAMRRTSAIDACGVMRGAPPGWRRPDFVGGKPCSRLSSPLEACRACQERWNVSQGIGWMQGAGAAMGRSRDPRGDRGAGTSRPLPPVK